MLERFEGEEGRRRRVEFIAAQAIVEHNDVVARKLAAVAEPENVPKGKQLFAQGEPGRNCLFFIFDGSFEVSAQGKRVAVLGPGQAIGEFPILGVGLGHAVTVLAREQSVVARIPEERFFSIAEEHPVLWKNMAKMLAIRLTNANQRDGQSEPEVIRAETITIVTIVQQLTRVPIVQLWAGIVLIASAFSTVAGIAYKYGACSF